MTTSDLQTFDYALGFIRSDIRDPITNKRTRVEYLNIGNNVEMTINDLAKMVIASTNSSSTIQHISHDERYGAGFEDTKRRVPDMNRAKTVLGYEPHTDFATGLNKTIAWWTSNLS